LRATETRLQHAANILTIGTGIAYVWTKYFFRSSDPYSNSGSPWEPLSHNSHVVVVPLLVFACGVIWRSHILPKWQSVKTSTHVIRKTASGLGLLFVLVPMILTGYLIQVSVDEVWRKAWVVAHLVTSAVWTLSYVAHLPWRKSQEA
jgi:hypothetical protein